MFHHVAWTRGTPYSTRGVSLGPDVLLLSYIFHALIIASTCIVTVMADHLCAHQLSRVPAWGTTGFSFCGCASMFQNAKACLCALLSRFVRLYGMSTVRDVWTAGAWLD